MTIDINNYIKLCPKCGSANISSPNAFILAAYIFPASLSGVHKDTCKDCGYQGLMPEVEKSKIEDFKKRIKNRK